MSRTITTTATLDAPAGVVWEVLTDLDAYEEWNPFVVEASGDVAVGERLRLRMQPEGGRGMTFRPRVLVAEPARELRWLGSLGVRGLFDGEHAFVLTSADDGRRTHLEHGETFRGLLVGPLGRTLDATERSFERMNAALAVRVAEVAPGA